MPCISLACRLSTKLSWPSALARSWSPCSIDTIASRFRKKVVGLFHTKNGLRLSSVPASLLSLSPSSAAPPPARSHLVGTPAGSPPQAPSLAPARTWGLPGSAPPPAIRAPRRCVPPEPEKPQRPRQPEAQLGFPTL